MGTDNETGNGQDACPGSTGLNLDARQRAMLEEMGVRVWWPGAADEAPAAPPLSSSEPQAAARPSTRTSADRPTPSPGAAPPAAPATRAALPDTPAPAARQPSGIPPAPAAPRVATASSLSGASSGAWTLQPPQPLFPNADPQHTPAALGSGWLIVVEGRTGSDPLAGDAGRLLENMLRALQLHRHPRTFVCLLDAALPAGEASGPDCREALASAVAAVKPAVLLLLGRTVARALLGRSDPLGRLRAERLQVADVPTVVSYDAPYLLRAPPENKALAWADLCRARALAGAAPAAAADVGTGTDEPHP